MKLNGSPEPIFDFDEERTWFQVLMPINPNFVQKQLMLLDLKKVIWDISGIDRLLKEILEKADIPQTRGKAGGIAESVENADIQVNESPKAEAGGIAGSIASDQAGVQAGAIAPDIYAIDNEASNTFGQVDSTLVGALAGTLPGTLAGGKAGGKAEDIVEAMKIIDIQLDDTIGDIAGDIVGGNVNEQASTIAGTIAKNAYSIDIQESVVLGQLDSTIAGTIADSIAGTIGEKEIKLLMISRTPINRENLLASLGLKNLRKNYEEYIGYLVNLNWLTMTIPHKPTSPKQKYVTTLKGRLILEFLKHKTK
jgi:hypothetical protein